MLAAAENAFNPIIGPPLMNAEQIAFWEQKFQRKSLLPGIPHDTGEEIGRRRQVAGDTSLFIDPNDGRPAAAEGAG